MDIGIVINTSEELGAITAFQNHIGTNAEPYIKSHSNPHGPQPHNSHSQEHPHDGIHNAELYSNFSIIFHESFLSKLSNQRSNAALQALNSCMKKIQHTYNLSSHHKAASKIDHVIQISEQKSFTGARIASTIAQAIKLSSNANLHIIDAKKLYKFINSQIEKTQKIDKSILITVLSNANSNTISKAELGKMDPCPNKNADHDIRPEMDAKMSVRIRLEADVKMNTEKYIKTFPGHINSIQTNSLLAKVFHYNIEHINEKSSSIQRTNFEHNIKSSTECKTQPSTEPDAPHATPNIPQTERIDLISTKNNKENAHIEIDNLDLLKKHIYAHLYTIKQKNKDAFASQITYSPSKYDM